MMVGLQCNIEKSNLAEVAEALKKGANMFTRGDDHSVPYVLEGYDGL